MLALLHSDRRGDHKGRHYSYLQRLRRVDRNSYRSTARVPGDRADNVRTVWILHFNCSDVCVREKVMLLRFVDINADCVAAFEIADMAVRKRFVRGLDISRLILHHEILAVGRSDAAREGDFGSGWCERAASAERTTAAV